MKTAAYLLQSMCLCLWFFYCSFSCSVLQWFKVFFFFFFLSCLGASSGDKEDFTRRTSLSKDETETCMWSRIVFDVE